MRKAIVIMLVLALFATGCAQQKKSEIKPTDGPLPFVAANAISQNVYDALEQEWDKWDALDAFSKTASSHIPGYCQQRFNSWKECEDFLGLTIPNGMEECDWLEQATYVGMPIGFADAPRVMLNLCGTEDGRIEWISADAGYRHGQIRVSLQATLYCEPDDSAEKDGIWSTESARQDYLSRADESPIQISSDQTEEFFSKRAAVAQDHVLYRIGVTGKIEEETQVNETFSQIIDTFFSTVN